ncbi:unnamed protein product [Rhizoctonia solani]|uniref:Uncharacterized protein n=2 Tax=Rhizoctonia solani TaxID=456999 RepID=A0A8H3H3B5_9AGAM
MLSLAHGLIALLVASPLVTAKYLVDGTYRVSYSAAGCGVGTQHYLDISSPEAEATFKPVPMPEAQTWKVYTHSGDPTWRLFDSDKHPDATLGYPNTKQGTRVRGAVGEDGITFNIIDTAVPDCYYVYPVSTNRNVALNGDTELREKHRFAYFRGPTPQYPLPIQPLKFIKV